MSELQNPEEVSTPGADSEEIIARLKGELEVALEQGRELKNELAEKKAEIGVYAQKLKHLMGQPRKVLRKHVEELKEALDDE